MGSVKCDNENSVPRIIVIQSMIPTEKIKQVEKVNLLMTRIHEE